MLSASHLARLYAQPEDLLVMISKIQPELLERQIQAGKWSIKENVAHLVRYQRESIHRIQLILQDQEPSIKRYVAEEDGEFPVVLSFAFDVLLLHLKEDRNQIHELLNSLSDDQLSRKGSHPVFGSLTLTEWVEFFLLHEAHHMMTIFKLARS